MARSIKLVDLGWTCEDCQTELEPYAEPQPYEQSRAYWINVWAGQALAAMLSQPDCYTPTGARKEALAQAVALADEIFGQEDEK